MPNIKVKLVLTRRGADKSFTVHETINTIEWMPGAILSADQVNKIISLGHVMVITRRERNK